MDKVNKNILVVDDNITVCLMLKSWLLKRGFNVETADSVKDAKQKVKDRPFDLILSDIRMPDTDGLSFLSWVKRYDSGILVIMMTGYADIETAVESMKSGAVDYIPKPIEPEQFFHKIDQAFLKQEKARKQSDFTYGFIKFPDEEYKSVYRQLNQTAENRQHRLIIGGRGVGKLSAVKYIYEKGIDADKPFVILDNEKLLDLRSTPQISSNREGQPSALSVKFEKAKGGLLYIQQVGYLDLNQQDELLGILTRQAKDSDFTQVIMSSDVIGEELSRRLIPKLYNLIAEDLITLPSIKGKKEVIRYLASYFLQYANSILDKHIEAIEPEALRQLEDHSWPGNIQELKNSIIKAALSTDGKSITSTVDKEQFTASTSYDRRSVKQNPIEGLRKEFYEKEKILEALELARGNKTMAASILNIDRKTLYNKIKQYEVSLNN